MLDWTLEFGEIEPQVHLQLPSTCVEVLRFIIHFSCGMTKKYRAAVLARAA